MEPTTSTAQTHQGADLLMDLYDSPDIQIQRIEADDEEQYRSYALSIYERIKSIKTGTNSAAVQESLIANQQACEIQYITVPVHEPTLEFNFQDHQIKMVDAVEVEDMSILIPVPKPEFVTEWTKQMDTYEKALEQQAEELYHACPAIITGFAKADQIPESLPAPAGLTRALQKTRNHLMTIIMKEVYLKRALQTYSESCANLMVQQDPSTNGIWINRGAVNPKTLSLPVVVAPVQKKLKFDARTTLLLAQMQFSSKPEVRATAKLDLNAKLDNQRMNDLVQAPGDVLAIAVAEARLTALEVLAVVFPRLPGNSEHMCLHCNTAVQIKTTFYHKSCTTVEWLTKYQPFKYNKAEGAIIPIKRAYISPTDRMRMCQLLELHAQLNGDIVVKNGSETTIWKRNPDGTLRKTNLQTIRDEDQIGSYAWRRKHGFTTRHGAVK